MELLESFTSLHGKHLEQVEDIMSTVLSGHKELQYVIISTDDEPDYPLIAFGFCNSGPGYDQGHSLTITEMELKIEQLKAYEVLLKNICLELGLKDPLIGLHQQLCIS